MFVLLPLVSMVGQGQLDPAPPTHPLRVLAAALGLSLRPSAASKTLCIVLGAPLALVLARGNFRGNFPGQRLLRAFVLLPLVLPACGGRHRAALHLWPESTSRNRQAGRPAGTGTFVSPSERAGERGLRTARRRRCPQEEAHHAARLWLAEVDGAELEERRPGQLSGGQAQRVAVARALATAPEQLLLDEPMAVLDIHAARLLTRVLTEREPIIITHDILDAVLLADRVIVTDGGGLTEQGPTRVVLGTPRSRFAAGLSDLNLLTGNVTDVGLTNA